MKVFSFSIVLTISIFSLFPFSMSNNENSQIRKIKLEINNQHSQKDNSFVNDFAKISDNQINSPVASYSLHSFDDYATINELDDDDINPDFYTAPLYNLLTQQFLLQKQQDQLQYWRDEIQRRLLVNRARQFDLAYQRDNGIYSNGYYEDRRAFVASADENDNEFDYNNNQIGIDQIHHQTFNQVSKTFQNDQASDNQQPHDIDNNEIRFDTSNDVNYNSIISSMLSIPSSSDPFSETILKNDNLKFDTYYDNSLLKSTNNVDNNVIMSSIGDAAIINEIDDDKNPDFYTDPEYDLLTEQYNLQRQNDELDDWQGFVEREWLMNRQRQFYFGRLWENNPLPYDRRTGPV